MPMPELQKIASWPQYRALTAAARQAGQRLSNLYLLPAQAQQRIAAGQLYAWQQPAGWLLLDDAGSFYRCYYLLAAEPPCALLPLEKPAVIELPFTGSLGPARQPELAQIANLGFALGRESARMERPAAGAPADVPPAPGVTVAPAQPAQQPAIAALLADSFDPLYSFLPGAAELAARIAAGQVLAATGADGALLGVLNASCTAAAACIDHLAVQPAARGRRVGSALVGAYHRQYAGQVRGFGHWVDIHNAAAVGLYRRFGYAFAAKKANEYVKR